ncbi:uncharacterized protein LOC113317684 isoform X1 [Papaver somniferum]|uniref:uncharacterized protein LOC113317684 isoform X1 n=1 Tax=Papaver somniferum TaxID=3469 RepID=UPI000E6FB79B|nr:uncharacterized protein LOC113317684 isoform X1 [Papaver somniferum]XP_026421601.1 uncharacterized protein LOC113317684 isoform X1 [Papaver somniferum]XP_026421602.1 uncharacterized protein LOC113317684 isoform X1 [Papaver somniferum]XP_026421603.1 uncharacterized protein LOC113317684 isoform X1 [Papaver somniferum]XP_026421604.1 uncharacterized protein LOC113317684 isoform X1 [Papaver somniferum]XP_026421605.1 uncharacterized protein LOC113317684 isoform X1 [Papaver somniferum]
MVDVEDFFSEAGQVMQCKFLGRRAQVFGSVEFIDIRSASKAVTFSGRLLCGQPVKIIPFEWERSLAFAEESAPAASIDLLIRLVGLGGSEDELYELLRCFGPLEMRRLDVGTDKEVRVFSVRFTDMEVAKFVLEEGRLEIDSTQIEVFDPASLALAVGSGDGAPAIESLAALLESFGDDVDYSTSSEGPASLVADAGAVALRLLIRVLGVNVTKSEIQKLLEGFGQLESLNGGDDQRKGRLDYTAQFVNPEHATEVLFLGKFLINGTQIEVFDILNVPQKTFCSTWPQLAPEYKIEGFILEELEPPQLYCRPCLKRVKLPLPEKEGQVYIFIDASDSILKTGYGVVIVDQNGQERYFTYGCSDKVYANSQHMEAFAIRTFLEEADISKFPKFVICGDNSEVMSLLNGREKSKGDEVLDSLVLEISKLVVKHCNSFPNCSIGFKDVLREENFMPDRLSHMGHELDVGEVVSSETCDDWTVNFFSWKYKMEDGGFLKAPSQRTVCGQRRKYHVSGICSLCKEAGHKQRHCTKNDGSLDLSSNGVLLKNVYGVRSLTRQDFDIDIREGVLSKCGKFGNVVRCVLDDEGNALLEFDDARAAALCRKGMHLKFFRCRLVLTSTLWS